MKKAATFIVSSLFVLSILGGVAIAQDAAIENTGPDSENSVIIDNNNECEVTNNTDIDVDADTDQDANSGDSTNTNNNNGGDADSGDADNDSNTDVSADIDNDGCEDSDRLAPKTPVTPDLGEPGAEEVTAPHGGSEGRVLSAQDAVVLPNTAAASPIAIASIVAVLIASAAVAARSARAFAHK